MNKNISAQTIIEYVVLFTVVCTVILIVALGPFKNSLSGMYGSFVRIFDKIRPTP